MFDSKRFRSLALGFVFLGAVAVTGAEASGVSVAATDTTVTMTNGIVNAQFRVTASNADAADITGLVVVLPGGSTVVVGDVLAGSTAASGMETLTYDASQTPTRAQTLPVRVKYTVGDQAVEQTATINLPVQD